jgi:hypothetical protein
MISNPIITKTEQKEKRSILHKGRNASYGLYYGADGANACNGLRDGVSTGGVEGVVAAAFAAASAACWCLAITFHEPSEVSRCNNRS